MFMRHANLKELGELRNVEDIQKLAVTFHKLIIQNWHDALPNKNIGNPMPNRLLITRYHVKLKDNL